jgi:hypothetical protein
MIELSRRGLRRSHPGASERDLALLFVALNYGGELGRRLADLLGRPAVTPPELLRALIPVAEALESLGVAYYVGGSVASSARGVPRASVDVDVVADLRGEQVQPLAERLRDTYYLDAEQMADAVARRKSFNLIHLETMLKVDVFVSKGRRFDTEVERRAQPEPLDEAPGARSFPVASPEDIVLAKLEWYRAGGEVSERQWGDVLGVLKT